MRQAAGFTLIELLVVILLAALLVGMAVASWHSQVLRTHRTEARSALLAIAAAQERHFLRYRRYAGSLRDAPPAGLQRAAYTDGNRYRLVLVVDDTGTGWKARAETEPGSPQFRDRECRVLVLDHLGRRGGFRKDGSVSTKCWR